ncbi:hypothetical protein ATE92_0544 [Ulvibacter sp. MAR_2010_11]|nr:hypothetical protein ATE92_0544 [Ulvibacter sp. MAR_2010_11]
MVSISKDSSVVDKLARKYANSHEHYLEMKRKYQEFSEKKEDTADDVFQLLNFFE